MAVTTNNLEIPHWVEAQSQPEVTVNEAFDLFDSGLAGHDATSIDFPSDASYTPTAADCLASLSLEVVSTFGNLTATRDLVVPDNSKLYCIFNNTSGSQSIQVKTSAGTGITIATVKRAIVFCDGTNVVRFSADQ